MTRGPTPTGDRDVDAPIIVSGPGRSGTTWMQWFLSDHPRIQIHGQLPNLSWSQFWEWYRMLVAGGEWSREANRTLGYEVAHYAGSAADQCREIFKRMFHDYIVGQGPEKPCWGLKLIDISADSEAVNQLESLWPDIRWVVCIRDPFATISSVKNTYVPAVDVRNYAARWVETCRFVELHDPSRVVKVQIDKLNRQGIDQRRAAIGRALACASETRPGTLTTFSAAGRSCTKSRPTSSAPSRSRKKQDRCFWKTCRNSVSTSTGWATGSGSDRVLD